MRTTRVVLVAAVTSAVVALLAGFGGFALANDVFPDVPDSSPFHDEVSEFGGAACADGFPDGTFHPTDAVKRQQLARFFTRCAGRVVGDDGVATLADNQGRVAPASVTVTAPATGYVLINADTEISGADLSTCGCETLTRLEPDQGADAPTLNTTLPGDGDEFGFAHVHAGNTWIFPITRGDTRTYELAGYLGSFSQTHNVSFLTRMTALFVPFGSTIPVS